MPTGYTADIPKGITFEQYALNCARAFGALVTMRDDPKDAPIPDELQPSSHSSDLLKKVKARLAELESMAEEDIEREAERSHRDAEKHRLGRLDEIAKQEAAYREMLAKVNSWTCPTPDHQEFGNFMREQIEKTIDFDCDAKYYSEPTPRLTGMQWLESQIAQALRDIAYHEKSYAEEVERTNQRNAWIKALRESLKVADGEPA